MEENLSMKPAVPEPNASQRNFELFAVTFAENKALDAWWGEMIQPNLTLLTSPINTGRSTRTGTYRKSFV